MSVLSEARAADAAHLSALYRDSDDPWDFRDSDYEQFRFDRMVEAVEMVAPARVLEVGCGNGEFARRIAKGRCYTGIEGAARAVELARAAVPDGQILKMFLPAPLPGDAGEYDLIVLSEILYFLDPGGVADLARQIGEKHADAWLLLVNYAGPTGHLLDGVQAERCFRDALPHALEELHGFRHDRFSLSLCRQVVL